VTLDLFIASLSQSAPLPDNEDCLCGAFVLRRAEVELQEAP